MSTEYLLVSDLEFDLDDLFESADADDRLTEWEEDFITDMKERRKKYGASMRVSDRQVEVLRRILRKVG